MKETLREVCTQITSVVKPFHPKLIDTCVDVFEKNFELVILAILTVVSEKIGATIRMESCLDEFHDNVCWGE